MALHRPSAQPLPLSPPLPSAGHLVLENIQLLASSPTAFRARYGHVLTPITFAKPGATAPAAAVLHFLLCVIDGDTAHALFKPCFPILDRQQERDFRRAVDTRLAALEKSKLLPVGSARKSVVASAGGDRFLDLLWSLSSLAVQQACLKHPPYGPVSRIRLMSQQMRSDSNLTHQSSTRSARSILSAATSRPDRSDPIRQQRRFLSVGMATVSQRRASDAEQMRTRIDSERAALARTTELAKNGAKTWASEANSLREKIGEFESKVRRLKGQLADMGFDENGNDIRTDIEPHSGPDDALENGSTGTRTATVTTTTTNIRPSSSREDLGEELKTSPIESMESGSSVDELPEPTDGCEYIAADISRLLTFATDTADVRDEVERGLSVPKTAHIVISAETNSRLGTDGAPDVEVGFPTKPEDIVDLVRAATDELEQATNRMDEIREAQRKADATHSPIISDEGSPRRNTDEKVKDAESLGKLVNSALTKHKEVVESSRHLQMEATNLTEQSQVSINAFTHAESDDSSRNDDDHVVPISKPTWLTAATADASNNSLTDQTRPTLCSGHNATSKDVDTAKDVQLLSQALEKPTSRKNSRSSSRSNASTSSTSSSRRKKDNSTRSPESRHSRSRSLASNSGDNSLHAVYPSPGSSAASKTPRSVRFAALPPPYSTRRAVGLQSYGTHPRISRCATEVFPKSSRTSVLSDAGDDLSVKDTLSSCDVKNSTSASTDGISMDTRQHRRADSKKSVSPTAESVPPPGRGVHRRVHSADERIDFPRQTSASSGMPSRMPRTQTPRRLVRRKEAIQRAAIRPSTTTLPKIVSSQLKLSADDSTAPRDELKLGIPCSEVQEIVVSESMTETKVKKSADSPPASTSSERKSPDEVGSVVKEEREKLPVREAGPMVLNTAVEEIDTVPKRLFATPEQSSASSSNRRLMSVNLSRKYDGSGRIPPLGVGANKNASKNSGRLSVPLSPKSPSIILSSGDDDEVLPSPTGSVSTAAKPPTGPRMGNATGFFAGQTAQWQQNVRSRSLGVAVGQAGEGLHRASADTLGSSPKSSKSSSRGTSSSSSARKSRVQSLKARLAAALK